MPHRVALDELMAALEATYHELLYKGDPRVEALGMALQYVYQQFYDSSGEACPVGKKAPWAADGAALAATLASFYGVSADDCDCDDCQRDRDNDGADDDEPDFLN